MERTRGAQGGVVTFPGLRLDVPGGLYTFRFSDDLYGLKLSITTRLREPHEISDTPVANYVSLINDEARDANRRNRRRHDSDNESEYDEEENESDDSFIVDDINGEPHDEEPVGHFSDDEEAHWEYHSDNEDADEEREQRRIRRQQRSGRRAERDVQFVEEHEEEDEQSDERGEQGPYETEALNEHEEGEEHEEEVQPRRRNIRVVEEPAFSSDGEAEPEDHHGIEVAEAEGKAEEHHESHEVVRPRRRNANQIVDSDEDEGTLPESEDEHKEENASDGEEHQHDLNDAEHEDGDGGDNIAVEDESDHAAAGNFTRKVRRSQWFQEEEGSDDEEKLPRPDAAFSPNKGDVDLERPRKRARGRDRQVRIIDEGESEEEQEQMERSIVAANSLQRRDDEDADGDDGSDSQFRRVHQLYDDEVDEHHEYDDTQQDEEDAPDYPDEDEYQEEEYYSENPPESPYTAAAEMATTEDPAFAQGMFVALWPKVERCHDYVELLLAAQEKLQATVDKLIAGRVGVLVDFRINGGGEDSRGMIPLLLLLLLSGLQEVEKAEGSSLVSYAERLRNFPARVERLQKKLARIEDRLLAMKESRNRGVQSVSKLSAEESAVYASPLF
ncbi:unnamed protein product [Phytophthora fragariaefolia]|uniref:Unnamed protein product n=1 Tax=Phytophthora fragariaefolia TaxID=1490495 RepID=A0A9W7D670_9STRA|nr:unnamed protein product [Phytophthora fragariaefolia]